MDTEQPEQYLSEQEPIDLDSPPVIPEAETYKRRRINSPDPIANAAIIDANLARILWDARDKLQAQIQKRRRRSDQSLSEASPSTSSSANQKPSKKARQTSPQPESGTKRPQSSDDSPASHLPRHNKKRIKREEIPSPSSRPHPTASSSRPKVTPALPKAGAGPSDPSAPNFILPSDIRTNYAIQVEKADKLRREGNAHYLNKNYGRALMIYTQAISSYPPSLFPNQAREPGYASSLANRASAYMALSQYQKASDDLQDSINQTDLPPLMATDNRSDLFKRVFRLVRCHLALLDGPSATHALDIIRGSQSNIQIFPNDRNYEEFQTLSSRAKFLVEHEERMNQARRNELWQTALHEIKLLEREVITWAFKFNLSNLPGPWTICKAEMFARLGKPVEAQSVVFHLRVAESLRCEYATVHALVALSNADISLARKRLSDILGSVPDYEPASCLLDFVTRLISSIDAIESTASRGSHIQAVALCDTFVADYQDLLLTTLRIKVQTIKCEQLAELSLKDPRQGPQLCKRVITLNSALLRQMNFPSPTLSSQREVYEPYRVYVVRALFAQARTSYQHRSDWRSIYLSVFELIRLWPMMALPSRNSMLKEIRSRIHLHSSSHSNTNGFHSNSSSYSHSSHHSGNPTPPTNATLDPKGYYQALGLKKGASLIEIRKAFRTLSLTHHPDKGGETELFQTINQAHSVLSNPETRSFYDLTGR